ncbi:hypothetical protein HXZ66_15745 [Bacillus sp. A116_S68]|jgi:hypothetical protein|nr:hypothetical protein HXZ66_15745 [Bacillus sp. A116_S68]
MKTAPFKHMSEHDVKVIVDACTVYREGLDKQERELFDLAFTKIVHKRGAVELDSMEMMLISKALKQRSIHLYKVHGKESMARTRQILFNLAHVIDMARIAHQQRHHPLKAKKKLTA